VDGSRDVIVLERLRYLESSIAKEQTEDLLKR
jgi:hypothetical protein